MNIANKNIFNAVINQDLCIGCGACLYRAQTSEWMMDWNNEGFLVPTIIIRESQMDETAINVCPFNPTPTVDVRTEDELANIYLKEAPNHHPKVGRYYNTYAGYSKQFRLTYRLTELFE